MPSACSYSRSGMLDVLGVLLMFVYIAGVIGLAAGVTWLVVKYSPLKTTERSDSRERQDVFERLVVEPVCVCNGLVRDLAVEDVDAMCECGIARDSLGEAVVGDRLDVRQRRVRQCFRRRDRHGARHVRDAVVRYAVDGVDGLAVRRRA